ncbi:hypothetical protein CCP4SC76_440001 [Gammaproteobacteria bacterium]
MEALNKEFMEHIERLAGLTGSNWTYKHDFNEDLASWDSWAESHPEMWWRKGGSLTDTIPALLTPGEFVVNKSAVSKLGVHFFDAINQMRIPAQAIAQRVRGFADGGLVDIEQSLLARVSTKGESVYSDSVGEIPAEQGRQEDAMRQAMMKQARGSSALASAVRDLARRPLSVQVAGPDLVRATQPDMDRIAARRL